MPSPKYCSKIGVMCKCWAISWEWGILMLVKAFRRMNRPCMLPFFGIWGLFGQNSLKMGRGHAGTGQDTGALNFWRRGDRYDDIHCSVPIGFKKKRDVEKDDVGGCGFDEGGAIFCDERVDDGFDLFEDCWIEFDPRFEFVAINRAIRCRWGMKGGDGCDGFAVFRIETVDGGVRIPDGDAAIGEHLGGG